MDLPSACNSSRRGTRNYNYLRAATTSNQGGAESNSPPVQGPPRESSADPNIEKGGGDFEGSGSRALNFYQGIERGGDGKRGCSGQGRPSPFDSFEAALIETWNSFDLGIVTGRGPSKAIGAHDQNQGNQGKKTGDALKTAVLLLGTAWNMDRGRDAQNVHYGSPSQGRHE